MAPLIRPAGRRSAHTGSLFSSRVPGLRTRVLGANTSLALIAISGCTPVGSHGQDSGGEGPGGNTPRMIDNTTLVARRHRALLVQTQ